ncbi:hypothetical protein BC828DRAFT_383839 [Blastocladiella britannica]|nr:hypothetical protein BC828DRAFT_383839 [Blastocladiella britannica]
MTTTTIAGPIATMPHRRKDIGSGRLRFPLRALRICFTAINGPDYDRLAAAAALLGALPERQMLRATTHLVVPVEWLAWDAIARESFPKLLAAIKWGTVAIVTAAWVDACASASARVPERDFRPSWTHDLLRRRQEVTGIADRVVEERRQSMTRPAEPATALPRNAFRALDAGSDSEPDNEAPTLPPPPSPPLSVVLLGPTPNAPSSFLAGAAIAAHGFPPDRTDKLRRAVQDHGGCVVVHGVSAIPIDLDARRAIAEPHGVLQWIVVVPVVCPSLDRVYGSLRELLSAPADSPQCVYAVTEAWMHACFEDSTFHPPSASFLYHPYFLHPIVELGSMLLTLSGFSELEAETLGEMLVAMGASVQKKLKRDPRSVLVAALPEGKLFDRAASWGVPAVSVRWIADMALSGVFSRPNKYILRTTPVLAGTTLWITRRTRHGAEIRRTAQLLGAKVLLHFARSECTHVIDLAPNVPSPAAVLPGSPLSSSPQQLQSNNSMGPPGGARGSHSRMSSGGGGSGNGSVNHGGAGASAADARELKLAKSLGTPIVSPWWIYMSAEAKQRENEVAYPPAFDPTRQLKLTRNDTQPVEPRDWPSFSDTHTIAPTPANKKRSRASLVASPPRNPPSPMEGHDEPLPKRMRPADVLDHESPPPPPPPLFESSPLPPLQAASPPPPSPPPASLPPQQSPSPPPRSPPSPLPALSTVGTAPTQALHSELQERLRGILAILPNLPPTVPTFSTSASLAGAAPPARPAAPDRALSSPLAPPFLPPPPPPQKSDPRQPGANGTNNGKPVSLTQYFYGAVPAPHLPPRAKITYEDPQAVRERNKAVAAAIRVSEMSSVSMRSSSESSAATAAPTVPPAVGAAVAARSSDASSVTTATTAEFTMNGPKLHHHLGVTVAADLSIASSAGTTRSLEQGMRKLATQAAPLLSGDTTLSHMPPKVAMSGLAGYRESYEQGTVFHHFDSVLKRLPSLRRYTVVHNLGGHVMSHPTFSSEWVMGTTHLVIGMPIACEKCMCAIASGAWVLQPSYIMASHAAGRFVDERDHVWFAMPQDELADLFATEGPSLAGFDTRKGFDLVAGSKRWFEQLRTPAADNSDPPLPFAHIRALLLIDCRATHQSYANLLRSGGATVVQDWDPDTSPDAVTHVFADRPAQQSPFASHPVVRPRLYGSAVVSNYLLGASPVRMVTVDAERAARAARVAAAAALSSSSSAAASTTIAKA